MPDYPVREGASIPLTKPGRAHPGEYLSPVPSDECGDQKDPHGFGDVFKVDRESHDKFLQ
ncbi:protein of unknown function [Burkholderia multivorans]